MARKKSVPCWRGAFLRALRRTGNVTLSAERAGVDKSTVYLARKADAGFAGKWVGALERARARGPLHPAASRRGPPPRPGEELVVRKSKNAGVQLVKASVGRWSSAKEATFLAGLARSGCIRSAARGCGLSTNALYYRKKHYADFATRWRAAEAEAAERVPALLNAAAIAALDPEIDEADLPPVSIDQALHICRMKGFGGPMRAEPEEPIEVVRARVLARLDAIEAARREREAGEG
jgi:hypothetical protein